MDQQDHHVRRLCAHPFAVPEFGHDGERAAVAGRAQAARAVPRPGAGRSVRRAVRAAGVGRLGTGPDACCARPQQLLQEAGLAIKDGKRLLPNGEAFRIEFLLDEPSIQPHHAPYIKNLGTLGIEASVRLVDPVQYRARLEDFDFDMTIERFSMSATPGDGMRPFFSSQAAATKGSYNLAGHRQSGDRRADREDSRRREPRRSDGRLPRLRPRVPRRALLGAAMVSHHASDRLLGPVRTSPETCRAMRRRRRARTLVVRGRQGGEARTGEIEHERLYRPPHSADDPDAARDPVRLLRRGAVRAGRSGRAGDRAAQRRRYRRHARGSRAAPAAISARARRSAPRPTRSARNTAARRGSIPISSRAWKSSSASTSRRRSASR